MLSSSRRFAPPLGGLRDYLEWMDYVSIRRFYWSIKFRIQVQVHIKHIDLNAQCIPLFGRYIAFKTEIYRGVAWVWHMRPWTSEGGQIFKIYFLG